MVISGVGGLVDRLVGIFGAPSFIVGGELYWGNDRLGDAIAKAALG